MAYRKFYLYWKEEKQINMRKLALDDEILLTIEKPARYIGNEVNAVMKDKSEVAVRFAMCFPDVYEIHIWAIVKQLYIVVKQFTNTIYSNHET